MSTLGKVLLFLNLLAAGGLIYVATQDWAKRQEVSGVVLRYQLTLQGLPIGGPGSSEGASTTKAELDSASIDVVPVEIQTASGYTLTQVSKKLFDAQFSGATGGDKYGGGGSVHSMMEEFNRAEKKLAEEIAKQNGPDGKLRFLVGGSDANGYFAPGLLMTMAESYAEREALRKLAYFPPTYPPSAPTPELIAANAKDAQARLTRKITALTSAPNPKALVAAAVEIDELKKAVEKDPNDVVSKTKLATLSGLGSPPFTRDDNDRRRRMALFLMLLDPSAAWQKRTMLVAGLKTYQESLIEQVARVTDIARQTERAIESDQATYEREYEQLKRLAIEQDSLVVDETANVKGLAETEARDTAAKAARQTQLNNLKAELAALQANIATVLGSQAAAEKAVFELQRKTGSTLRGNLDLETTLDKTEQAKP